MFSRQCLECINYTVNGNCEAFPNGIPDPNVYWSGCGANVDPIIQGDAWYDEDGIEIDCCADLNCLTGSTVIWNEDVIATPRCNFIPLVGTTIWDTENPGLIVDAIQCEYPGFEPIGGPNVIIFGGCTDPTALNENWIQENINDPFGIGWNTTEYCMWCNESFTTTYDIDPSLCACCGGGTAGSTLGTTTITPLECINDLEFVTIEVTDQNGNPVEGYEIILDCGNIGFTNSLGTFNTVIENASVNTEHNINVCHCFTTAGQCSQTLIKIKVTDCDGHGSAQDLTINKANCTPISES